MSFLFAENSIAAEKTAHRRTFVNGADGLREKRCDGNDPDILGHGVDGLLDRIGDDELLDSALCDLLARLGRKDTMGNRRVDVARASVLHRLGHRDQTAAGEKYV